MRSELPWLESRSPWHRFGPTLLGLTIIGVGMGGAIRIVKAQDTAAPPTVTAHVTSAVTTQTSVDAPRIVVQDDQVTSRELEDLLQQRAQLDARISDLRQRLRSAERGRTRIDTRAIAPRLRVETRIATPRVQIDPSSPDWQRSVEDARQMARDAMQQAREAMRQAQEALREAQRSSSRINGGRSLFTVPTPGTPAPPKFNYNFNKSDSAPFVYKMDAETMKRFQDQMKALGTQEQWAQRWKEMQPQYEQQMRDFEQRMQEWQRNFESQQRLFEKQMSNQKFRSLDSPKLKTPRPPKSPDEATPPEQPREKGADRDTDNEPL